MKYLKELDQDKPWLKWVASVVGGIVLGSWVFSKLSMFILDTFYLSGTELKKFVIETWYDYYKYYYIKENAEQLKLHYRNPNDFKTVYQAIATSGKIAGVAAGIAAIAPTLGLIFRPKGKSLHGDARFANTHEVKKAGLINASNGILIGRFKKKFMQLTGARFVALAAPTRAGKGVGIVIPNLLNWEGSVVCLDIKGENFDKTSGFRSKYQAVYKFDPFSDNKESHCYNPLTYISADPAQVISDIQSIARIFWARNDADPIWNDSSVTLFQGLVLFILDSKGTYPLTMGEVLRQAGKIGIMNSGALTALIDHCKAHNVPLSPRTIAALRQHTALPDEARNSVLGTFNAALQIFSNPMVDAATSKDDFDLRDLRKRRQTIYLCVAANRLGAAAPLMNLFFSQLIQVNTTELPEQNPDLKHSVLVLLDEFTSLGKVEIIEKSISYIAGYNLRLLLIYQSQAQLAATYGADSARNIITNCGCQILFAPREQSDAEEYSKILGNTTVKAKSKNRSVGLNLGKDNNPTDNISEQQRALLLPQEMKDIGKDKCVVIIEDVKPIFATKIKYYEDKIFTERLLPAISVPKIEISQEMLGLHALPENEPELKQNHEPELKTHQPKETAREEIKQKNSTSNNNNDEAAPNLLLNADFDDTEQQKQLVQNNINNIRQSIDEIMGSMSDEEKMMYAQYFLQMKKSINE